MDILSTESAGRILPGRLPGLIGREATLCGIIHQIRRMRGFAFVILRGPGQFVQCVYSPEWSRFNIEEIAEGMSVRVAGMVEADGRSRIGCEIRLISVSVLSSPAGEFPVAIRHRDVMASLDTLLDYRPLTLRNERQRAIFTVQEGICEGFARFLRGEGFTAVRTPKLVSGNAEGGANVFTLEYFGRQAALAQSPQLYKQALVGVFERVYEIGPVFRAEKHDTSRHMSEYTSVDFEMGFIDSFYDIMRMEARMIASAVLFLEQNHARELELWQAELPLAENIPVVRFDEGKRMVALRHDRPITDPDDFDPEEERLLSAIVKEQTGSDFVFVTHYHTSKRPFYAMDDPDEPSLTLSFDLLFRGLEVTTGGQRIHDYQAQADKMRRMGLDESRFEGYLMAHKFGLPPHGGLGMGLERFTARLLGLDNVRLATLFPRDTKRLEP